jgi:membrane protease YdiL (CAAX protease family)
MIWYRLSHTGGFTSMEMIVYPLLFGGSSIFLLGALNKYYLRKPFSDFSPGKGKWGIDILAGLLLTAVMFLMVYIERRTLINWLPPGPPPPDGIIELMFNLKASPVLLALYFGPVLVIGIALFEELTRVFLLNCLWSLSKAKHWQLSAILLASALIGAVHLYQGWFGIVSIGLKSIVMCFYFYKYRRIMPLILSHYLYDGIQFAMFISSI